MFYNQNLLNDLDDKSKILFTKHFNSQKVIRGLANIDVINAIRSGTIIEKLQRYNQGEKYLIFCQQQGISFHISFIYNNGTILLKTIYIPNTSIFQSDLKTRRERL